LNYWRRKSISVSSGPRLCVSFRNWNLECNHTEQWLQGWGARAPGLDC